MMEYISSRQNPRILEAVALKNRKNRKEKHLFFFEGKKLLAEAVKREVPLVALFLRQDAKEAVGILLSELPTDCKIYEVSPSVYEKLTEENSPEGIFCVAKTIDKYHKFATIDYTYEKLPNDSRTLLMAVSIQDPGNLGNIMRSCAAFDCGGLIVTADCADPYASKTVRASMGAVFDLPMYMTDNPQRTIETLRRKGYAVYGGALDRDAVPLEKLSFSSSCCFLVGNEGHGIPKDLLASCTGKVFIPITERTESLNASVAAAILLYHRFKK